MILLMYKHVFNNNNFVNILITVLMLIWTLMDVQHWLIHQINNVSM